MAVPHRDTDDMVTELVKDHGDSIADQFISDVRHHVQEEEGELFPRLHQTCLPEQLRELGDMRDAVTTKD